MKLPSIHYLTQQAGRSFTRFYLTILSAVLAGCFGVFLNENRGLANSFPYINVMLCAALGISLYFCANVFARNKDYTRNKRLLLELGVSLILVALYFTLPDSESTHNTSLPYIRYTIYSITAHLLVAIIPFLDRGRLNGFWHYNKILFVRLLTSLLYSGFLFAGLAMALASLDFLFDMEVHKELYFDLFIVIGSVFNTWFFVAGIPQNFDELDEIQDYPKGIRIFSQYVLLPLLALYLVILYVYAGKIIILWSWPKGLVSYLIACVAVLGILTLLLIHPYSRLEGNAWIKKFSRIYYFILLPLVALLFIAIGMRVADYGITINRYVIVLLGIWLTIVCAYFCIGKTSIKFIPISLAVILMAMSFGPWGMFSVSERSQVNRLSAILEENKILVNRKIQHEVIWRRDSLPELFPVDSIDTNERILSDSLHNEVMSILNYLDDHHGFNSIKGWFRQDIDSIMDITNEKRHHNYYYLNEAQSYMRSMGLKYEHRYKSNSDLYFNFRSVNDDNDVLDARGYEYIISFSDNYYHRTTKVVEISSFEIDQTLWTVQHDLNNGDKLMVLTDRDTIVFHLDSLSQKLLSAHSHAYQENIPASEMTVLSHAKSIITKMELLNLGFESAADSVKIDNISGRFYFRIKK